MKNITVTLNYEDACDIRAAIAHCYCEYAEKAENESLTDKERESASRTAELWDVIYNKFAGQIAEQDA